MLDYSTQIRKTPSLQQRGLEQVFNAHYTNTLEGFNVTVDGVFEKRALIQKHSNPINSHLEDKLFSVLVKDSEGVRWGSYVDSQDGKRFLILTNPESTDGVTLKSKIRKTTDVCTIVHQNQEYDYDCIATNYLLYDDKTYTTDTKVFEEDERKAIVIPFDEHSSKIRVIDDVRVGNHNYRVIKIEPITEIKNEKEEGVIQLVLIRTTFGDLYCNDEPLRGIVRFARMKDKILNSKSRELITDHNQVKSGDYIKHSYQRDSFGNEETRFYIVRSLIDMHLDYDVTYMLNCDAEFYMWDDEKKEPVMIPCYVEDNRTRFEDGDKTTLILEDSQFQIIVQENAFTAKLGNVVNRILLKGRAYEIVGTDNLSLENAVYVGLSNSKVDPNKDNIELGIGDFEYQCTGLPTTTPPLILGDEDVVIGCEHEYEVNTLDRCIWSIDNTSLAVLYRVIDNKATIKVVNNRKNIGETFNLICEVNGVAYSKQITVLGW